MAATLFICLFAVAPTFAEQAETFAEQADEGFHADVPGLDKQSRRVAGAAVDVYAGSAVDVDVLFRNVRKGDSAQTIYDKVNAVRQKLYPDEQIILAIGAAPGVESTFVQAIAWWNNVNAHNYYWYAQYVSGAAVMFIDDVLGFYRIYDRVGTGNWVQRATVGNGATYVSYTRSTWGPIVLRGFKGLAVGNSRADIVMWFFR